MAGLKEPCVRDSDQHLLFTPVRHLGGDFFFRFPKHFHRFLCAYRWQARAGRPRNCEARNHHHLKKGDGFGDAGTRTGGRDDGAVLGASLERAQHKPHAHKMGLFSLLRKLKRTEGEVSQEGGASELGDPFARKAKRKPIPFESRRQGSEF